MVQRDILNVPVDFPYEPYSMQLSMMTRIIGALNKKQNCLLESPTGTGKTMALLCSTLAWLKNQKPVVKEGENPPKRIKIYFGTRTHKQIGQVVREMGRSAYKRMPMTILSSRKQSCVNNHVLSKPDINEACVDACKKKECVYRGRVTAIPPDTTWDIENMKVTLKKKLTCLYYQSRTWSDKADIIFCPYNYILNPSIRESMGINLKDAIIILDEGHNIEDICREGASAEITLEILNNYKFQFFNMSLNYNFAEQCKDLMSLVDSLKTLIESLSEKLVFSNEDILKKAWNTADVVIVMADNGLGKESVTKYMKTLSSLIDSLKAIEAEDAEEDPYLSIHTSGKELPTINAPILRNLESLLIVLEFMLNEPTENLSDFKVIVTEMGTFIDNEEDTDLGVKPEPTEYLNSQNKKRKKDQKNKQNFVLNVLCMNPGIVFKDIASQAHSIILASGTLAPLSSFQRELSCSFDASLEAGHVVCLDQTLIASVGCGPKGMSLTATYKNVETFNFQDELGSFLFGCCKVVPNGVLCFVASFHMIDKLFTRWKATGLIDRFRQLKTLVIEPRNSTDMEECMKEYYARLREGALMLAVYRGKVSEGMDFADEAARLVVCVGIPYPSVTDYKVNLKREYNDNRTRASADKSLYLSGQKWYSIQAYRALNQAIGRCIRHKDDWGAMIFLDDRFASDQCNEGLCKWIRQRKKHFRGWTEFISTLESFIGFHLLRENQGTE